MARPLRILVVEDHLSTAAATTKLLSLAGHTAFQATCAKDARALAAQRRFDLLLSDIGLPDESGLELMRAFKTMYGMVGIAVTVHGQPEDFDAVIAAGFAAQLVKPINFNHLLKTIEEVSPQSK